MTGIYSRYSLQNEPFMILNNLFIMALGLFNNYEDKKGLVSDQSNIYLGLTDICRVRWAKKSIFVYLQGVVKKAQNSVYIVIE